jgi:2-methylcitrate dehydratase
MLFIIASILEKAYRTQSTSWQDLMLLPEDYTAEKIHNKTIRKLMDKINVVHGGLTYDQKYPQGIPTSIRLHHAAVGQVDSGLIMYPLGHAQSNASATEEILNIKINRLASLGVENPEDFILRLKNVRQASSEEVRNIYQFDINQNPQII